MGLIDGSVWVPCVPPLPPLWIPAFAGMTRPAGLTVAAYFRTNVEVGGRYDRSRRGDRSPRARREPSNAYQCAGHAFVPMTREGPALQVGCPPGRVWGQAPALHYPLPHLIVGPLVVY